MVHVHIEKSAKKSICVSVCVCVWCPTLCDPMDCIPPGSSIHGILQARVLEWAAIPFSREVYLGSYSNVFSKCNMGL